MSGGPDPDRLVIKNPFSAFFYEEDGEWIVHMVGMGMDNITWAKDPLDAAYMLHDMLAALTDRCTATYPAREHDYCIQTTFDPVGYEGEPPPGPAWECSRCKAKTKREP